MHPSVCILGNHPLEGLYKAAAQGDRSGIMHVMKVGLGFLKPCRQGFNKWSVCLQLQGPGAPIDALDGNGCTPLMYAVMADSRLAVEMLLNFSAKRETVSNYYTYTKPHFVSVPCS